MEEKKSSKRNLVILFFVVVIIIIIACCIYINSNNEFANTESNVANIQNTINDLPQNSISGIINADNSNNSTQTEKENILLYRGIEIAIKTGTQDISDMAINADSINKYNTTYHNYEGGKYEGSTTGTFGEETYEGFSVVNNIRKIAMTHQYNAIPREYKSISELPEQLNDMADYSSININEIDLDGDGNNEYLVCYTVDYTEGQIGNGEPQASSGIMLFDSNYQKIADLVSLENGFWANIKEEHNKRFLSLDDVEYIDIDNDDVMEIIIEVPTYEGIKISILKYSNNKVEGEINLQASVLP